MGRAFPVETAFLMLARDNALSGRSQSGSAPKNRSRNATAYDGISLAFSR